MTVTHRDPREAALWANTLADVYIEQSLATRVESARKAYEWLQERLAATQQGMREAQDKLFQSYRSQDLFVPEGSVSAVSTSIAKLNEDFVQAQARRIAIEAALKQAREMQRARRGASTPCPRSPTDPVVTAFNTQIAGLTVELGRLGEKFKEGHPEVQKVKAQVEQLKKAKQARAAQILDGLDAEYAQLRKREAELRGAIDSQKAQAANQSRKATELEALQKEADSAKGLYEVLLQKLNETDIAASIRSNNVSVVDRASPPQDPVRPQKRRIALVGLLLGLLAGLGLVLGARLPRQHHPRPRGDRALPAPRPPRRGAALRGGERLARHRGLPEPAHGAPLRPRATSAGQVVLVTGTAPQEGKTTTIVNLARLLAGSGEKTVVVDCDLRRAQMHQRLGLPREPGFTDFFVRHEPLVGAAAADLARRTSSCSPRARCRRTRPRSSRARASATLLAELQARVRLGAHRLAAARLGHRRAAARAARRPHRARRPAQQGGQEARQAQRGRPAQGDAEPARARC